MPPTTAPPWGDADRPAVVLVLGDEELLVTRAVEQIAAAVRAEAPDAAVTERQGGQVDGAELLELLSPSLFAEAGLLVIRAGQDVLAAQLPTIEAYLRDPSPGITLVVQHAGGGKGKNLLTALRAVQPFVIECPRLTRTEERADFVRNEVRRAGATITPDAIGQLLEAVGTDLRELAIVTDQLAADSGGTIDGAAVAAYHRGRADVSGFAVSDKAVVGDVPGAMETLRWARSVGVAHVLIADALADGVRSMVRVSAVGNASPNSVAARLGMPPWKVRRAQSQARGWTEPALARALTVVADLNADVKGAAADPDYALERAIWQLARLRRARAR